MNGRCSSRARSAGRGLLAAALWLLADALAGVAALELQLTTELSGVAAGLERVVDPRAAVLSPEEHELPDAVRAMHEGRMEAALARVESLIARRPNFRLAHLVYGDLMMARTAPLAGPGAAVAAAPEAFEALIGEARRRLGHRLAGLSDPTLLPRELIAAPAGVSRIIVVEMAESRLYVFRRDGDRLALERSFYVSTGKNGPAKRREGDQRTPVGVYFITGRIAGSNLDDFYGPGALPIDYPNEWDLRLGRTGYGIWIHGVPSASFSRPPFASDGCMALANDDMRALLRASSDPGTPVILADRLEWVPLATVEREHASFAVRLDAWREAWESRDPRRYESFYAAEFRTERFERAAWIARKMRAAMNHRAIRVGVDNVGIYDYPGERDLRVVTFDQDFRGDGYHDRSPKRQYWRRTGDGEWRIVYEGTVALRDIHLRGIPYSARGGLIQANR